MVQSLGLRRRSAWWLVMLGLLSALLLFLFLRMERRPESASRETTTTRAEVERTEGAPTTGAAGRACDGDTSCAEGSLCTRGRCAAITRATTECRDAMVRFARGAQELSSHAVVAVERAARCLKANRTPQLAIEPSSDPTLSAQANEELTKKRRVVVRTALEQRGVAPERLGAVGLP